MMVLLDELAPGSVCLNSTCPTGIAVPHMANDNGPHPRPYGEREASWGPAMFRKVRRDRRRILGENEPKL
jgi:hypothetical protein